MGDPAFPVLRQAVLFLVLTGILIPLLQRLRVNQVLGFLAAGTILGPLGLGLWTQQWPFLDWFTFHDSHVIEVLAELGVVFLMFLIGLELSVPRIWAMRRWVFGAGLAQVLVTGAVLGAVATAFSLTPATSLVLGLVLALSSTAVVVQLLTQRRALASTGGQATFAVLMFQDLAIVPLLILIDVLAARSQVEVGWLLGWAVFKSIAAVVVIFLVGRRVVHPLFHTFSRQRQPEVFMALTLLTALGIGGATAAAGLSMALGAFLAGLLLGETQFRHEVEVTVEPFKGLLMGVFFMSVGMEVDLRRIVEQPLLLVGAVVGLFALKGLVAAAVFRLAGLSTAKSVESGLMLAQGGEFAFIAIGHALAAGLLAPHIGQFALLLVSVSLFATPAVARLGQAIAARLEKPEDDGSDLHEDQLHHHVIVAGSGRVGQLLAGVLAEQSIPFVAIEHDPRVVARLRARGLPVVYGNAARPELLRKLHADRARAVVMTMDQPAAAMHTVRAIREEYPNLPVFARSRDEHHAKSLLEAGATVVVPEALEGALQLSGSVLLHLGLAAPEASAALENERTRRLAQVARPRQT